MADEAKENQSESTQNDIEEIVKQRVYNKNKELERKTMENEQLKQQLAQIQEQMGSQTPQPNQVQPEQQQPNQQDNSMGESNPLTRQDLMDAQQQMQDNMENERHKQKIGELLNGDPKFRKAAEENKRFIPLEVEKDLVNNLPPEEAKRILHSILTNDNEYNKMMTKVHASTLYGDKDAYPNWVKSQLNQNSAESQAPNEGPDLKGNEGSPVLDKMEAVKGYLKR